jgi:hypothetical protein
MEELGNPKTKSSLLDYYEISSEIGWGGRGGFSNPPHIACSSHAGSCECSIIKGGFSSVSYVYCSSSVRNTIFYNKNNLLLQ